MATIYLIVYLITFNGSPSLHIEKVESMHVCKNLGIATLEIRKNTSNMLKNSAYYCVEFKNGTDTDVGQKPER